MRFADEPAQKNYHNIPITKAELYETKFKNSYKMSSYILTCEKRGILCHLYLPERKGMVLSE